MHLIRVTGIIIVLNLLLVAVVGTVQAGDTRIGQSNTITAYDEDTEEVEDATLICLALVGGTVLLAGGVWVGKLRRMLP